MEGPRLPPQEWGCRAPWTCSPTMAQLVSHKHLLGLWKARRALDKVRQARPGPAPPCPAPGKGALLQTDVGRASSQAGFQASRGGLPSSLRLFSEASSAPTVLIPAWRTLHAVTLLDGSTVPAPSFTALRAVEVVEVLRGTPVL